MPAALLPLPAAAGLAQAGFARWATYRQAALAGIFTNTVFGVIKLSVLFGITDATGGTVAGYDRDQLSTYVWTSQALIAVVFVFGWFELAQRIRTGDIAVDLARPVDLQLSFLATDLGRAGWSLLARGIAPMAIGGLVFGLFVPRDVTAVVLLLPSVALAVVVSYGCRFLVSLVAFWTVEVRGVVTVYVLTMNLLCGLIIPVQLFPTWLRAVAYATPFPWLLQAPCDLASGQATGWAAAGAVAAQLGWAVALLLAGRLVLRSATRRLVVQGG